MSNLVIKDAEILRKLPKTESADMTLEKAQKLADQLKADGLNVVVRESQGEIRILRVLTEV